MFKEIINYLSNNPTYMFVLIAVFAVVIVAVIVLCVVNNKQKAKKSNKQPVDNDNSNDIFFNESVKPIDNEESCENIEESTETSRDIKAETDIEDNNDAVSIPNDTLDIETESNNSEEISDFAVNETIASDDNNYESTVNNKDTIDKQTTEKASSVQSAVKKSVKPETAVKTQQSKVKETKDEGVKYSGKWVIYEEDGRYIADLKASNGEKMLTTESYSSLSGVKSGIETLKKNIEDNNYGINMDKNGNYVFKIFSTAKRLLCVGEGYSTFEQCEKAFASVKRFSKTAVTVTQRPDKK